MKIKREDDEFMNILNDLEKLEVVATTIKHHPLWQGIRDYKLGGRNTAKLASLELLDSGNGVEAWQVEWDGVPSEMSKGIVVARTLSESIGDSSQAIYGFAEQK